MMNDSAANRRENCILQNATEVRACYNKFEPCYTLSKWSSWEVIGAKCRNYTEQRSRKCVRDNGTEHQEVVNDEKCEVSEIEEKKITLSNISCIGYDDWKSGQDAHRIVGTKV